MISLRQAVRKNTASAPASFKTAAAASTVLPVVKEREAGMQETEAIGERHGKRKPDPYNDRHSGL